MNKVFDDKLLEILKDYFNKYPDRQYAIYSIKTVATTTDNMAFSITYYDTVDELNTIKPIYMIDRTTVENY